MTVGNIEERVGVRERLIEDPVALFEGGSTPEDLETWRRAEDKEETAYPRECRGRHESFGKEVEKLGIE